MKTTLASISALMFISSGIGFLTSVILLASPAAMVGAVGLLGVVTCFVLGIVCGVAAMFAE